MLTDKLFTGQREMRRPEPVEGAGLGIYHYQARFYSPKIGRFLSADTIVPSYANPQNLNRFSYVLNNPLRYTDPTGHMVDDGNDSGGGKCDSKCLVNLNKDKNKPKKKKDNGGNDACTTVTCNALNGDILAIADLLIPTHFGWRWQGEISLSIGGGIGIGPSGTIGVNGVFNRNSGEFATFLDWSVEGGAGAGSPVGASVTTGPIVGWGSSTVRDVANGNSVIVSGTVAPDLAVSGAVSAPVDGDSIENVKLHVDPVYGQVPTTAYGGGGIGTLYGGVGAGGSHVFASAIFDLFP